MNKLCIFAGTVICSYGFWALGAWLDFSFFINFLLSGAGSVVGVWLGWKAAQRFK